MNWFKCSGLTFVVLATDLENPVKDFLDRHLEEMAVTRLGEDRYQHQCGCIGTASGELIAGCVEHYI